MSFAWPSRNCNIALRAGAVKARSAAERGGGAKRRGLDGAKDSGMIKRAMAADRERIGIGRLKPTMPLAPAG
jgi:hypothetical protein